MLYETTAYGGTGNSGTVFSLTPPASAGGAWTETVLHGFSGSDGANPQAGRVAGSGGVLYGTTNGGGTSGSGTVFSLRQPASPGGSWTEAVIHSFSGSDGGGPDGSPAISGGMLYGTTNGGGASGSGTVFSLSPPASPGGSWTEAVLRSFGGGHDGAGPQGGVGIDPSGVLFGTTTHGRFDGLPGQAFYGYGTVY